MEPRHFEIIWLGVAGFVLKYEDKVIVEDPYLSHQHKRELFKNFNLFDLERIDAILISHGHFDHFADLPEVLERFDTDIYLNNGLVGKTPKGNYKPLTENDETHELCDDISVRALRNAHIKFDAKLVFSTLGNIVRSRKRFDSELWKMVSYPSKCPYAYVIKLPDYKILSMGSCALVDRNEDALRDEKVDLFCVPVQGRSDILDVAYSVIERVKPKNVLLYHWDNFYPPISRHVDVEPLVKRLKSLDSLDKVYVPEIGKGIKIKY